MITISEEALALIEQRRSPIFIAMPHTVSGCCFEITDCPSIGFGIPNTLNGYSQLTIQGSTVYVPGCIPEDSNLVIRTRSILGFKKLVLSGWRLT